MANLNLFSQIISKIDRSAFKKLVKEKQTDKHQKGYNSWTHLVSMLFCQFAKSQSVRDISNGLRSATGNLNHLGVERAPSKSSVSYQNKHRDWRLFRDFYYQLQGQLSHLAGFKQVKFRIKSKIFLLDSTTISLCLSLFDWAKYKTGKGAVKMHTLLDYDGNLPAYVNITDGKTADNKGAYDIPLLAGSVIVADRFYNDFSLLNIWDSNQVYFVIRHKDNLRFNTVKENDLPDDRNEHILIDEVIELTGYQSANKFPKRLGASRYSKGTLDKVYKRGLGAYYSSGSRPKVSAHQWAMGRVNSFLAGGPARKVDSAQWNKVKKHRKK